MIEQVLLINLHRLVKFISMLRFISLKYGTLLVLAQSSSIRITEKVSLNIYKHLKIQSVFSEFF